MQQTLHKHTVNSSSYIHIVETSVPAVNPAPAVEEEILKLPSFPHHRALKQVTIQSHENTLKWKIFKLVTAKFRFTEQCTLQVFFYEVIRKKNTSGKGSIHSVQANLTH